MKALDSYKEIRAQIDLRVDHLTQLHQKQLKCKKGCDKCCYSFRVLPIEFYAMAEALQWQGKAIYLSTPIGDDEKCAFLANGVCTIYNIRPIICRTHGLPLLTIDEATDDYAVSVCDLNFTEPTDDGFSVDDIFEETTYNSALYEANLEFLEKNPELGLGPNDLIPVKLLKS